jgi:hypothetical protein
MKYTKFSCNSNPQNKLLSGYYEVKKPIINVGYACYTKNFMQLVWNWWFHYCHLQGDKYTRQQQHVNRCPYQAGSSAKFPKVPRQLLPNAQLCSPGVTLKPQNNDQTQRKSQLQLKTNTHLFPSHFQLKILKQQQQGTWCSDWTYIPGIG